MRERQQLSEQLENYQQINEEITEIKELYKMASQENASDILEDLENSLRGPIYLLWALKEVHENIIGFSCF